MTQTFWSRAIGLTYNLKYLQNNLFIADIYKHVYLLYAIFAPNYQTFSFLIIIYRIVRRAVRLRRLIILNHPISNRSLTKIRTTNLCDTVCLSGRSLDSRSLFYSFAVLSPRLYIVLAYLNRNQNAKTPLITRRKK